MANLFSKFFSKVIEEVVGFFSGMIYFISAFDEGIYYLILGFIVIWGVSNNG
jgi:hypothetical protein